MQKNFVTGYNNEYRKINANKGLFDRGSRIRLPKIIKMPSGTLVRFVRESGAAEN
ncbi:MAG: hypothetical protein IJM62_04065 [Lachnospiraceae bacterium]|nr:hypothetical protein [Lachnospiraceae bacterium]